jgi:glyoxylase-like metal-dependent hydrolase (beta-lactamase superfamily II)
MEKEEILRISDFLYRIKSDLDNHEYVCSYLIIGEYLILVDSGTVETFNQVLSVLKFLGYKRSSLKLIINTHSHSDHIGSNASLKEICGCLIIAHQKASRWIENHQIQCSEFLEKFPKIFLPTSEDKTQFLAMMGAETTVDIKFNKGLIINLGRDLQIQIISTPGHTAGSVCIYEPVSGSLITGDSFVGRGIFSLLSQYDDVESYLNSIRSIGELNLRRILPSHTSPIEGIKAKAFLEESYSQVNNNQQAITEILISSGKGLDLGEIAHEVCKKQKKKYTIEALFPIFAHLKKLEKEEVVRSIGEKWVISPSVGKQ